MLFDTEKVHLKSGVEVELRPARVSEASLLLSAFIDAADTSPYILSTPEKARSKTVADQEKLIAGANEDPQGALVIAVLGDRVVAVSDARSYKDVKRAHRAAFGMSVHQDFRGQGLGEALLRKLISVVRDFEGVEILELNVMAPNVAAHNLYKKMGFVEVGRYPGAYVIAGEGAVDDITMCMKL